MAKSSGTKERLHGPVTYLFEIPMYWCREASFEAKYEQSDRFSLVFSSKVQFELRPSQLR